MFYACILCTTFIYTHTESLLDELGLVSLFSLSLFRGAFCVFVRTTLFFFQFFMLHVFSWLFCFGSHVLTTGKSPKRPIIC